jgi:hypothetical protein
MRSFYVRIAVNYIVVICGMSETSAYYWNLCCVSWLHESLLPNHRNSRTGPQIAAYIFDRVTVFKNVSATSKYLLVLSECMDSNNILSIEPNLPLLKLVKFYGVIKKDKEWHPPFAATFSAWVFPLWLQLITIFFRILFP